MGSKLQAALYYLRRGWSVFPIAEGTKKQPKISWSAYTTRLPTEKEVRDWWSKWPNSNIGIITGRVSNLVVVDYDGYKDGAEDLRLGNATCTTARGGKHYYYTYPENATTVSNRVNIKPGYDVRGDGGYVVAGPSVTEDGSYAFTPGAVYKEAPPRWTYESDETFTVSTEDATNEGWVSTLFAQGFKEGERNNQLARLCGYLFSKGLPFDIVKAQVETINRQSQAPLPANELERTVKSICAAEIRKRKSESKKNGKHEKESKSLPFTLTRIGDFNLKHGGNNGANWLIPNWYLDNSISFWVAPPESYKTWLEFDLALSIALGLEFFGEKPKRTGPVLIIQQEDAKGDMASRLHTIWMAKTKPPSPVIDVVGDQFNIEFPMLTNDTPIYLHEESSFAFHDDSKLHTLEKMIEKIKPVLIIIDPLYSAADQTDYMASAVQDMRILKRWRDNYGVSTLLVHHTKKSAGKDSSREGLWGSQYLNAFLEQGYQIRKVNEEDAPNVITIRRHFKGASAPDKVAVRFDICTEDGEHKYVPEILDVDEVDTGTDEADPNVVKAQKQVQDKIKKVLRKNEDSWYTAKDIAEATQIDIKYVRQGLRSLADVGTLAKNGSKYSYRELGI